MWYTDVSRDPWIIRQAESPDGRKWRVAIEPVLGLDQEWEKNRLFYPTVAKIGDTYLMWYGSYWRARPNTTALGFAVSLNGIQWQKHPQNPVLRPDPERPWESNYVTSQSVMLMGDGSLRIWYASRKQPPFVKKYFAINTARWADPPVVAAAVGEAVARPTRSTSRTSSSRSEQATFFQRFGPFDERAPERLRSDE